MRSPGARGGAVRDRLFRAFSVAHTHRIIALANAAGRLTEKLSSMREQYDIREKHFSVVIKSKELEHKLMEARLAQQTEIAQSEAAIAAALRVQIDELGRRELQLREQIEAHVAKFEQVQDIIAKSNGAFTSFKKELEQTGKKVRRLEKDNETLRQKNDTLNSKMIELVEERATLTKTIDTLRGQKTKLENLCRALQTERKQARKLLEKYEGGASPDGEPATSDAADQGSAAADQSASAADSPALAALDDEAAA